MLFLAAPSQVSAGVSMISLIAVTYDRGADSFELAAYLESSSSQEASWSVARARGVGGGTKHEMRGGWGSPRDTRKRPRKKCPASECEGGECVRECMRVCRWLMLAGQQAFSLYTS